jgi:hypothetical protein
MADIQEIKRYTNRLYEYIDEHDTFTARGLQINEIREKLNEVIDWINNAQLEVRYSDGTTDYRHIVVSGNFQLHKKLTDLGWDGTPGVDYEIIESIS